MIDKFLKLCTVNSEIAQQTLRKGIAVNIDVDTMRRAFGGDLLLRFNFESLRPRKVPIEDIEDPFEFAKILEETVELQSRTAALNEVTVRAEAHLNEKSSLQKHRDLYCVLPENSEAEKLVGVRIVRLLREEVAKHPDFRTAYIALVPVCGEMEFMHETLMRLLGEKFFPAT